MNATLRVQASDDLINPSVALFSEDGVYRYLLTRRWDDRPAVVWVMLNPSTADAFVLDPTVRRCVGFTKSWGWGGIQVVNRFGLRSTDPKALKVHADPIGKDNAAAIIDAIATKDTALVVAAWGADPSVDANFAPSLADLCAGLGKPLRCLGRTAKGAPRHPLYVRGDQPLEVFS